MALTGALRVALLVLVALKLVANAAAKAASQPMELVLRETESGLEHPVRYMMASTEENGALQGYTELVIDSTGQLWLTLMGNQRSPRPLNRKRRSR